MKKTKKQIRKHISKTAMLIAFLLTITACESSSKSSDSIASVDGVLISNEAYLRELDFYQKYYSERYGEEYLDVKVDRHKSNEDILEAELIDSMIKDQVMLNDLKNNGIKIDDNAASNIRKNLEDQLGGRDSLKANIKAIGTDENKFNQILYNDSIRNQHYNYFLGHSGIKDSEVLDFYKKNEKYHKQYKYNVLVFDDKNEAEKVYNKLENVNDFKLFMEKDVKNYEIIKSDFVYIDDDLLKKSSVNKKNQISDIFEYDDKYMILLINSFNENENELLIYVKDIYLKQRYEQYLNKLTKKSKIRLFV